MPRDVLHLDFRKLEGQLAPSPVHMAGVLTLITYDGRGLDSSPPYESHVIPAWPLLIACLLCGAINVPPV